MKHMIFALRDNLANTFLQPQLYRNENVALRTFTEIINETKVMKNNPQDYELWILGEFDDVEGTLTSNPQKLATGLSVKKED